MADETFRQERKKINPADLGGDGGEGQENAADQLRQMAQFRQMAAQEVGREHTEPTLAGQAMPGESNPGIKIQGKVPPQFAQMLAEKGVASANTGGQRPSAMSRQSSNQPQSQFTVQEGGSDLLKGLLKELDGITKSQYEQILLPSRGVFYDGNDGPADGIIELRPMTGDEEQILATPRFVKKGQAINMIFQRCIKGRYRPEDFLTVDRTHLLIYLRGISYTPEYDVEIKCPECGAKFNHVINLSDLLVEHCPSSYTVADLEGVLPTSGYKFKYRLSRGRDEQQIQDYRERKLKMFGEAADDTLAYRAVLLLQEIEGLTDKDELKKLVAALPINDVAHIRNSTAEPPFGVNTQVEIVCPNCYADFAIDLPLEANFFFPRQKKKDRTQA